MTLLLLDAEWNGDAADVLHVISVSEYPSGPTLSFTKLYEFADYLTTIRLDKVFIHAGLTADVPVINSIAGYQLLDPKKVVDTFVVSRLVNYKSFSTHSLKELGEYLGTYKGDYDGGWDSYSEDMRKYCEQDVEVLRSIVKHYWPQITNPDWSKSMRLEHDVAWFCADMQANGFKFNSMLAEELLDEVHHDMATLEAGFKVAFPPRLEEFKRIKYRVKDSGELYKNVAKAIEEYPKTERVGDELVCYDYKQFKPGSPKERIDVLWDAGWKPFDKTKGHIKATRSKRWLPET